MTQTRLNRDILPVLGDYYTIPDKIDFRKQDS